MTIRRREESQYHHRSNNNNNNSSYGNNGCNEDGLQVTTIDIHKRVNVSIGGATEETGSSSVTSELSYDKYGHKEAMTSRCSRSSVRRYLLIVPLCLLAVRVCLKPMVVTIAVTIDTATHNSTTNNPPAATSTVQKSVTANDEQTAPITSSLEVSPPTVVTSFASFLSNAAPPEPIIGADKKQHYDSSTFPPPLPTVSLLDRLPNLFLIGAQKGGTTTIAEWLFSQPDKICRPIIFDQEPYFFDKEVQFFDQQTRFVKGLEFYAKRFQLCDPHKWRLDATPNYLNRAQQIYHSYTKISPNDNTTLTSVTNREAVKGLKFIVILRDPVARDMSWYNHMVNEFHMDYPPPLKMPGFIRFVLRKENYNSYLHGGGPVHNDKSDPFQHLLTYDEYVDRETLAMCDRNRKFKQARDRKLLNKPPCLGLYAQYLKEWIRLFDRKEQLLVLSFDELKNDERSVRKRIQSFLRLEEEEVVELSRLNDQAGPYKMTKPSCTTKAKLDKLFQRENQALYTLLLDHPGPSMEQVPFPKFSEIDCRHVNIES